MAPTESIEDLQFQLLPGEQLALSGSLTSDSAQAKLRDRFVELDRDIAARALDAFKVDLRRLEFVNSSSIRLFVDWISRAETARYKLVFEIDPDVTWHRLSFPVLQSLAPDWVEVVEITADSAVAAGGSS